MRFRKQHDEVAYVKEREATAIVTGDVTPVQRQFAKDSDINELVRRFGITGKMPQPVTDPSYYGDVEDIPDLRTALERIRDAQERFAALPARVRTRFRNDPAELFEFLEDRENFDEAVKLGLVVKPEAPAVEPPAPLVNGDVT